MSDTKPIALVTGGSVGIGASICQHLLDADYVVLNLSRRKAEQKHERLIDYPVDLADVEATRGAIAELSGRYEITNLVHNAGVIRPNLIEDVRLEDVEYLTNLHVKTSILLMQGALATMKKASFGRVVIISSRALLGLETRTAYAATKAAQVAMVRTWAMELGPSGIRVNAVSPLRLPCPAESALRSACRRTLRQRWPAASLPVPAAGAGVRGPRHYRQCRCAGPDRYGHVYRRCTRGK